MYFTHFADIPLPTRMIANTIKTSASLSRLATVGALVGGYVLDAQHDTRAYVAEGVYLRDADYEYDIDHVIDQLRALVGTQGTLRQKMRDTSNRIATAWLTSVEAAHDTTSAATRGQRVSCGFEVDGYWADETPTTMVLTSATSVPCGNAGNMPVVAGLTISITSATTNPLVITNTRNGFALTYAAAKSAGVTLAIDCGANTVLANTSNVYGYTSRADTQIELMRLEAGWNKLTFNQAVTGIIKYRHTWM